MKSDQYSSRDSVKVKARANYMCEMCGSNRMVQAHAPNGDHSDWRKGICLCAEHHSEQHPNIPRNLFFTEMQQPYWPNISARALALAFGCHNRTVIRAAKKLQIASGVGLSDKDKQQLWGLIVNGKKRVVDIPKEGEDPNYMFTAAEVTEILGVHINSVRHWIKTGDLRAYRTVKCWRIMSKDLADFASRGATRRVGWGRGK